MTNVVGTSVGCRDQKEARMLLGEGAESASPGVFVPTVVDLSDAERTTAKSARATATEPPGTRPSVTLKTVTFVSGKSKFTITQTIPRSSPTPDPDSLVLNPVDEPGDRSGYPGMATGNDSHGGIRDADSARTTKFVDGTPTVSVYYTVTVTRTERETQTVTKVMPGPTN
ncbi:hypothetical protein RJ55_08319 [Drechmeria coniospora]|nr:hypothetical protein RJ55_08319 [Drechmeria coniospora]